MSDTTIPAESTEATTFSAEQAALATDVAPTPEPEPAATPEPEPEDQQAALQRIRELEAELKIAELERQLADAKAGHVVVASGVRIAQVSNDFVAYGGHRDTIAQEGVLYCSQCLQVWPCPSAPADAG